MWNLICRKNGKLVGTIEKDIKGPLYPTIAVHSQNEEYVITMHVQFFTPLQIKIHWKSL